MKNLKFILFGIIFGIVLSKSEVISWFRIQEMFRFQSFHMYGIIGSAVLVGMISIFILKYFKLKSFDGSDIVFPEKKYTKGTLIGGIIFGMGWALTGACPGPLYIQVGAGVSTAIISLLFALIGTWVYSYFRPNLPH